MSLTLAELEFLPASPLGLAAGPFKFGTAMTLILGPNGSGKTPIVHGLAFVLGHAVQLPPAILARCKSVRITVQSGQVAITIERAVGTSFDVVITEGDSEPRRFSDERSFSLWLIRLLGMTERNFLKRTGDVSSGYMSVLMPMFFVDQDLGWRDLYSPLSTHSFFKDQTEEILRWVLDLPSRNRPVDKTDYARAKARLESAQEQVEIKRLTLEALSNEIGAEVIAGGRDRLVERQQQLSAELRRQSSILEVFAQTSSSFDDEIADRRRERDFSTYGVKAAENRMTELHELGQNLEAEVRILEMNETAADAFRVLCGNEACQFFRHPEESYGRQLLYLKDQLKDFRTSSSLVRTEIERLKVAAVDAQRMLDESIAAKERRLLETPVTGIVPAVNALTAELASVNTTLVKLDGYDAERKNFETLINRAINAEEEAKQLRPTRGGERDESRIWDFRSELARSFTSWLETLGTQNVPTQISVDDQMRMCLGDQPFTENSPFRGSTRTRIVLAFHAAVIEAAIRLKGDTFPFLILDTPRQQELHITDLQFFIERFLQMLKSSGARVQLIVAATEAEFMGAELADQIWRPSVESDGKQRFFRTVVQA